MNFLGTSLPLIQAPMAGSQNSRLAMAVGHAGALGSIPAAMLDSAGLEQELGAMARSGFAYNVNFFAHCPPAPDAARDALWMSRLAPYYAELGLSPGASAGGATRRPFGAEAAEVLERFKPPVVSFHFGLPSRELLERVKRLGSLVLSSATTLAEAKWLQANGADAVIIQGLEAGGHRGHFLSTDVSLQSNLMELLPLAVETLAVPVIAAGGIATASDVQACMNAGADAVQVGTVFLLCPEATTNPLHRKRLLDQAAPTALTNLFSGGLARGMHNRAMQELGPVSKDAPPFPLAAAAMAPLRSKSEALGRDDFTPLWSGTNRAGCAPVPAKEVVQALAAGFSS